MTPTLIKQMDDRHLIAVARIGNRSQVVDDLINRLEAALDELDARAVCPKCGHDHDDD